MAGAVDVSIVIATFNRVDRLRATLTRLEDLEIPQGSACEVVVVDNNSTDGTRAMIEAFARRRSDRFRYAFEGTQGKSLALNTGIREANGDVLVFTDDDCLADPGWVRAIVALFESDSALAGIGGRVELYDKDDRPVTIRTTRHQTSFTSSDQLFSLIPGCNMAFRRHVLEAVGPFDRMLGPGNRIGAAEDSDLLYRAYRCGFKMLYAPEPVVYHNHGRQTDDEILKLNRQYLIGRGAFYAKHILNADRDVLRMAYWEASNVVKSLVRDFVAGRRIKPQWQRLSWLARGIVYRLRLVVEAERTVAATT